MDELSAEQRFSLGYKIRATPVFQDGKWVAKDIEWYLPNEAASDKLDQTTKDNSSIPLGGDQKSFS